VIDHQARPAVRLVALQPLLFVFGTRPEAIKLAPLVRAFQAEEGFRTYVCVTAQHREMLDQVLTFFGIQPDFDLNLMQPAQSLNTLLAKAVAGLDPILADIEPALVFVQGDTTSTLAGAMAAFHRHAPVAHVEAGLRSGDMASPFPEEMNRVLTSRMATLHFAPTERAAANLAEEGISAGVHVVGNTGIDALQLAVNTLDVASSTAAFPGIDFAKPIVLVTCHRRESFGDPFREICAALSDLAAAHPKTQFVYPVHLNPAIRETAERLLTAPNIRLLAPLAYPELVWLMSQSRIVLTDSGGIQEEAPSLSKPVLVMRNVTERIEGVEAGTARLVGTDREVILRETSRLLDDKKAYKAMAVSKNPYGDGQASARIVEIVTRTLA
jgi:UDP-N-acetylglucosamine 2-epimerase (non-hydrolysing)